MDPSSQSAAGALYLFEMQLGSYFSQWVYCKGNFYFLRNFCCTPLRFEMFETRLFQKFP